MNAHAVLAYVLDGAVLAFAIAMLLCGWRLLRGPTPVDRVLAFDTLYVNLLALVILLGIRQGSRLYFEAALIVGLLGFIGTVALARFLCRGDVME